MNGIEYLRKRHGLNQTAFARALGVHQTTISYWERRPWHKLPHFARQILIDNGVTVANYSFSDLEERESEHAREPAAVGDE